MDSDAYLSVNTQESGGTEHQGVLMPTSHGFPYLSELCQSNRVDWLICAMSNLHYSLELGRADQRYH